MAYIVCLTSGLTGILHASFELVARLEQAGHRLSCGSPLEVKDKVEAQGIHYVQLPPGALDPEPETPNYSGPTRRLKRWAYKWTHRRERKTQAYAELRLNEVAKLLNALNPDLLIIDVELHEYILMAYQQQRSFLLLSQWFSLWNRPGLPYLLEDIIPGKGWRGSLLGIKWSWFLVRIHRAWMFAKKRTVSVGTDRRSMLLEAAHRLHFPMAYIRENYWPGPFTYSHLPVISMTALEMEFPHPIRANLHYIGPMVYTDRRDTQINGEVTAALEGLLQEVQDRQARLIYCSVSSLKKGDQLFLNKLSQAVSQEPNWVLVVGLGGLLDRQIIDPLPANVHPFAWVPQLQLLEHADLSINHGGIHTINECIHFQVPMLVYSGKRSDQNGCAARVAYHRLGATGDKDLDTVEQIREKIKKVLTDEEIKNNVGVMHRHYLRYREACCLEKLVEGMLNKENKDSVARGKPLAP